MQALRNQSKAMNCINHDSTVIMEAWELEISGETSPRKLGGAEHVHWLEGVCGVLEREGGSHPSTS